MTWKKRVQPWITISNVVGLLLLAVSFSAFVWLRRSGIDAFSREGFETLATNLGPYGPFIYIVLIALTVVVSQLPGVPLVFAAGALWGPLTAGLYSVIGGFIGGMIAYYLGRTLGRSGMKALTGKVIYFDQERGERYLALLVFVTRLLPILSFDVISYAAGLTGLSALRYALATFAGMVPSTFFLAYVGATFTVNLPVALGLSGVAVVMLLVLPWLIRRHNLFGLSDLVRFE